MRARFPTLQIPNRTSRWIPRGSKPCCSSPRKKPSGACPPRRARLPGQASSCRKVSPAASPGIIPSSLIPRRSPKSQWTKGRGACIASHTPAMAAAAGVFGRPRNLGNPSPRPGFQRACPAVGPIAPARNEAATIAQTLTSLFNQNYAGQFSVVLVDDHSEDATAQIARQTARERDAESRISIRLAPRLPPGWTGKLWALNEGVGQAASATPTPSTTLPETPDLSPPPAFPHLPYPPPLPPGPLTAIFLTYLAPVALLFARAPTPRVLGFIAWLLMSLLYLPTVRFYRLSPLWAPLLPLSALIYSYATCLSATRYYLGSGAQWKGRTQAYER